MQMQGKVLSAFGSQIQTKKGGTLNKTRLKVLDQGPEAAGDVVVYWVDFLGESALSETDMERVLHQDVTIEIRRVAPTKGNDGKAYLNVSGGAIRVGGQVVQSGLQNGQGRRSA